MLRSQYHQIIRSSIEKEVGGKILGSEMTLSIMPYVKVGNRAIVGGNLVKVIHNRFDDNTITRPKPSPCGIGL
ncbi:hypothetical protein ACEUBF_12250 [Aeromonas caviae]